MSVSTASSSEGIGLVQPLATMQLLVPYVETIEMSYKEFVSQYTAVSGCFLNCNFTSFYNSTANFEFLEDKAELKVGGLIIENDTLPENGKDKLAFPSKRCHCFVAFFPMTCCLFQMLKASFWSLGRAQWGWLLRGNAVIFHTRDASGLLPEDFQSSAAWAPLPGCVGWCSLLHCAIECSGEPGNNTKTLCCGSCCLNEVLIQVLAELGNVSFWKTDKWQVNDGSLSKTCREFSKIKCKRIILSRWSQTYYIFITNT